MQFLSSIQTPVLKDTAQFSFALSVSVKMRIRFPPSLDRIRDPIRKYRNENGNHRREIQELEAFEASRVSVHPTRRLLTPIKLTRNFSTQTLSIPSRETGPISTSTRRRC
ncbi:hypothetical protein RB195_020547 [Necator americanus]|uniref:Uncharacterized protein n=1 Tax=Necator americanus TaxID=51031 RepID=A0ABR1CJC4_NECAM